MRRGFLSRSLVFVAVAGLLVACKDEPRKPRDPGPQPERCGEVMERFDEVFGRIDDAMAKAVLQDRGFDVADEPTEMRMSAEDLRELARELGTPSGKKVGFSHRTWSGMADERWLASITFVTLDSASSEDEAQCMWSPGLDAAAIGQGRFGVMASVFDANGDSLANDRARSNALLDAMLERALK